MSSALAAAGDSQSGAAAATSAAAASASSAPLLQTYPSPPSAPPASYFALVGRDFAAYSNALQMQLGRSADTKPGQLVAGSGSAAASASATAADSSAAAASIPCLSLGSAKLISRVHVNLQWERASKRWRVTVLGKNGLWVAGKKYVPREEKKADADADDPGDSVILASDCATLLRVGIDDAACLFWFVPAQTDPNAQIEAAAAPAAPKRIRAKPLTATSALEKAYAEFWAERGKSAEWLAAVAAEQSNAPQWMLTHADTQAVMTRSTDLLAKQAARKRKPAAADSAATKEGASSAKKKPTGAAGSDGSAALAADGSVMAKKKKRKADADEEKTGAAAAAAATGSGGGETSAKKRKKAPSSATAVAAGVALAEIDESAPLDSLI